MKAVVFLLFLCLSSTYVSAQVTTSSFEGRITDQKGEGLPGATIQLTNLPTGTKYGTTTDLDGRYRIFNANPGGPYEVAITFVGYKTQTRRDVTLQLGANIGNDLTLADENTTLTEVIIKADRGGDKQGAGINIGEQSIRQLPTLSRSFQDVTRLTPQASNNNSFAGTNFRYNNVTIDGTINNDAIGFSPSLGGQSGSSGTTRVKYPDQPRLARRYPGRAGIPGPVRRENR